MRRKYLQRSMHNSRYSSISIFEDTKTHVPEDIVTCVKYAYAGVTNDPTQTPVLRIPIVGICYKCKSYVDAITSNDDLNNLTAHADNNIGMLNDCPMRDQIRVLQA